MMVQARGAFTQIVSARSGASEKRQPRYLSIRDDLFEKIAHGGWAFEDPLPSEMSLAQNYGVALGTIRRAVEELVREGVLERRHGRGTYVRQSNFSGSLVHYLRQRSTHSTISAQETRILACRAEPVPADVAQVLGLQVGELGIYMDRRRYHNDELFAVEENWLVHDRFAALLDMPLDEIGPFVYQTYDTRCNQRFAYLRESLRIVPTDPKTAEILRIDVGGPTALIERTAFDFSDRALEWRISHARTEHFEYRVEVR